MPVKYTVKRNSLSSKWGVWSTDTTSTVEKQLVELKSSEQADKYLALAEAGEPHEVIMASLTAKKPKNGGGGLFGKMFKRGAAPAQDEIAVLPVSNPVIEIEPARKQEDQQEEAEVGETTPEPAPAVVAEAPSRFQVIEQAPAPPTAPPTPKITPVEKKPIEDIAVEAEVETEEARPEGERIKMVANKASLSTEIESAFGEEKPVDSSVPLEPVVPVEATAPIEATVPAEPEKLAVEEESQPVAEVETVAAPEEIITPEPPEPVAPPIAQPEVPTVVTDAVIPEPPVAEPPMEQPVGLAPAPAQPPVVPNAPGKPSESPARGENGLLVDWSFTPPPDVTPEELRASGQQPAIKPAPSAGTEAKPARKIDPELSEPAAVTPKQPVGKNLDSGKVSVEICVSKALKDSASGDASVSDKKYNSIASKEYTEVSKAFASGNSPDNLREELTHLAAVCIAWADAIEKRKAQKKRTNAA